MNVIKQRQLPSGTKLTPKTDFVYNSKVDYTAKIYDLNGSVKGEYIPSTTTPIRVGKGQILMTSGAFPNLIMYLLDNNGNAINSLTIDTNWNGEYHKTKDIITFLGKPFVGEGDNDRYVMFAGYNFNSAFPNYYDVVLFNIDKWEISDRWEPNGGQNIPSYSFVFDGVDTVYYMISDNRIIKRNIKTGESPVLQDNTGTNVLATEIYHITDNKLFYKEPTIGQVAYFDFNTLTGNNKWGDITKANLNAVGINNWMLMSNDINGVWLREETETSTYFLSQAMVDNFMIGAGETGVSPQLITNFEETDTTIIFTMIYVRTLGGTIGYGTFNIDKASGTITIPNRFWRDSVFSGISQEILNNSFANSCNSYGVGTFYNYGLQKQWDTYFRPSVSVLEEEYK